MSGPPPALLSRLAAVDPALPRRAVRLRAAVRRASADLPAGELLWLDRLHAAGHLTDHQAALLADGREGELRVGPHVVRGRLGPRTRLAAGGVLKRVGAASEPLVRLCQFKLDHPAVVAPAEVVGQGETHWVRSRAVAGPTLAEHVGARGRMAGPTAYALARRLAGGLAAAEAAGLIHGEIHAHNVRLTGNGPGGGAVLVDCGLAPLLAPRTGDAGRGGWVDPPDGPPTFGTDEDLAAFARLLWGVLAGRPPFLLARRRYGTADAARPPLAPIADLAPDTPAPLAELIDALTGHAPADAPASFAEVAGRLRPVRPPVSPVRTGAWAVACGVALAGIVGAANAPVSAPPADAVAPSAAVLEEAVEVKEESPVAAAPPAVRRVAVPPPGR